MPAAARLDPAGVHMDDGLDVARMLRAPRASGIFPDARPEGFSVPEQWTNHDRARRQEIINHPPVVVQEDIPDKVANCFHAVEDEYRKQVEDLIRMCENADQDRDAVAAELVHLQK